MSVPAVSAPKVSLPKGGAGRGHSGRGRGAKPPNWLAPMTQQQIVGQATKTIKSAYTPAYGELTNEAQQAQAIADKRSADNKYYQQWLNQQTQALQSHADAANAQVAGMEQQLNSQQQSLYSGQAGTAIGDANAREGNVSNNAQSNAFNVDLPQNEAGNEGLLNSASRQAVSGIGTANASLNASAANEGNVLQAGRTKQMADFQTAMTGIANQRTKLNASQNSDIVKEIARLQGIEIQKAQSNRSFGAVVTKLGIQTANTKSLIDTRTQNANTAAGRLKQTVSQDQIRNMQNDRNFQLHTQEFNAQTARDLYERNHGLGPYKVSKTGTKPPLSQASQNVIYGRLSTVRTTLQQLTNTLGSRDAAWHALHNGQYTDSKGKVHFLKGVGTGGDDGFLNAAFNTMSTAGGLTPGDINFLKKIGLANPGSRLNVVPNYTSGSQLGGPH